MRAQSMIVLAVIVSLLFLSREVSAEKGQKAKSIDELAAMYDSGSCEGCHPEVYKEWQNSIHSKSIFGWAARTAATFKTTVINGFMEWPHSGVKKPEDVRVENLMICAKCHLPQLREATDDVAKEIIKNIYDFTDGEDDVADKAAQNLQKLNINCLVCHNRNAITHKWAEGYPEKNAVYGTKEGAPMKRAASLKIRAFPPENPSTRNS